DEVSDLSQLVSYVEVKYASSTGRGLMKTEECLQKRCLARSIRPEQTNTPSGISAGQLLQNWPATQIQAQFIELNKCHAKRGEFRKFLPRQFTLRSLPCGQTLLPPRPIPGSRLCCRGRQARLQRLSPAIP